MCWCQLLMVTEVSGAPWRSVCGAPEGGGAWGRLGKYSSSDLSCVPPSWLVPAVKPESVAQEKTLPRGFLGP